MEATLIKTLITNKTASTAYSIQRKVVDKVTYLVVPVVMMVEGVHSGSRGAVYHSIEELGKSPESWNGIPVTIYHPQKDGNFISANSPEVPNVGRVYNAHVDGDKLKGEVWCIEQKLIANSPTTLAYLQQGKPLEVSVGVFTEEEVIEEQEWNGEAYSVIAKNHHPDHLALLPGEKGACSWEDGCGIRVNSKLNINQIQMEKETIEVLLQRYAENKIGATLQINESSVNEIMRDIQSKLNGMDVRGDENGIGRVYHYLEDLYSDYFVFYKSTPEGSTYYKQGYATNAKGQIEFVGDVVEVKKSINYVQVNQQGGKMSKEKSPCCLAKIEQLITNKRTAFTDADKAWLLEQDEATLDKLFPIEPTIQVNMDEARTLVRNSITTEADIINLVPESFQESVKAGLALYTAQRADMIQKLVAHSKDAFSKEELEAMNLATLTKMTKLIPEIADYSAQAGGQGYQPQNNGVEVLMPTAANV